MTARPIIFSAPMIRALLAGEKTQTRRIVKRNAAGRVAFRGRNWHIGDPNAVLACPYGQPGDLLWVRETWAHYHAVEYRRCSDGRAFSEVSDGLAGYRADGFDSIENFRRHVKIMSGLACDTVEINGDRWRPSIHMPRWASRLTLRITDVRVQRVQEISEADALAEGILADSFEYCGRRYFRNYRLTDAEASTQPALSCPRESFRSLWESLHGPDSWSANPHVWALTFDVIRKNVDEVKA